MGFTEGDGRGESIEYAGGLRGLIRLIGLLTENIVRKSVLVLIEMVLKESLWPSWSPGYVLTGAVALRKIGNE